MTQPDQLLPERSWNDTDFGPISALASKPQEDWEGEQLSTALAGHQSILDYLFDGLETGVSFPVAFLAKILEFLFGFIPGGSTIFSIVNEFLEWAQDPLSLDSIPFLSMLPTLFGNIPIGSLTSDTPNLLPTASATFAAGSIATSPDWSVDSGSTRTADGSGSATVEADGHYHALRSGKTTTDYIPIGSGQTISESVFVAHEGYAGSGASVELQIVPVTSSSPVTFGTPVVLDVYEPAGADLAWPGHELIGSYSVPSGVIGFQKRYVVKATATAGTLHFDDAYAGQVGLLGQNLVDGLPEQLQSIISRGQLVIDTIFNTLTDSSVLGNTFADLTEALRNINPANITGVNGPENIAASLLAQLDALVGGAVGQAGTGASNADAFNIFKILSSNAAKGSNSWEILGQRNNSPVDNGLLPSSEANFNISVINTTLTVTPTVSLIATMRVLRSAPLGVVSWLGCGTAGVTAFYLNIRKIDAITGDRNIVYHSPNIVGDLVSGISPDWEFCELADPLARVAGEDYEYEFVTVGGNHSIRGISLSDDIPDHPFAQVISLAATRNSSAAPNSPPTTIAKASVVNSPNVPWIETAIDTGNTSDQHDPITVYLTLATTVPVPNWATYVDAIALGKGGDGASGATFGFGGNPGTPGKFNAATWVRETDFTGTAIVAFVPADDTHADTVLSIPDHSVTAENGVDGEGLYSFGGKPVGRGPGTLAYVDESYSGGGDQSAWGGDGAAPGGAGNGGSYLTGFLTGGGKGGNGAGWLRFRPGEIVGGGIPLDTTPPTPPTLITLNEATPSTLTVTVTGGSDEMDAPTSTQRRDFRNIANNSPVPNFPVTPVSLTSLPANVGGDLYVAAGGMTMFPTTTARTAGYCRWNAGAPVKEIGVKWIFYQYGRSGNGATVAVVLGNRLLPDHLSGQLPDLNAHVYSTPLAWGFQVFDSATNTMHDLDGGTYSTPLKQDASYTEYQLRVTIEDDTATVYLPDGDVQEITDSRIASYAGNFAYDECLSGAGNLDGLTFIREDWFIV